MQSATGYREHGLHCVMCLSEGTLTEHGRPIAQRDAQSGGGEWSRGTISGVHRGGDEGSRNRMETAGVAVGRSTNDLQPANSVATWNERDAALRAGVDVNGSCAFGMEGSDEVPENRNH